MFTISSCTKGPGGSVSQVVGLPNNSYKPITNTAWVSPGFVNYKKGCTRIAAARDKVYQLLAHGRWFSPGTPASSSTKTGRHDIAEILLKVALNTKNQSSCTKGTMFKEIRINISITTCFRILLINLNVYIIYMCIIIMCNIELIKGVLSAKS